MPAIPQTFLMPNCKDINMKMNNILLVSNDAGFLYLLGLTLE